MSQGFYQLAIGKSEEAIESFEVAYRIFQRDNGIMPISSAFLGAAYVQVGRPTDALALLLEVEQKDTYGSAFMRTHNYMALAQAHLSMGALPLAQAAIGSAEKISGEARALGQLAAVLQIRASIAAADPAMTANSTCAIYQRAIDIGRPCGMRPLVAQCLAGMAQACEASGDVAAAATYNDEARHLFDELGLPATAQAICQ